MESPTDTGSDGQHAGNTSPFLGKKRGFARVPTRDWLFLALAGALTLYYLWGIMLVPFHPDESTYLFMSSDFETLLQDPLSLAWQHEKVSDLRQHYRAVDPPLTRDLLGLGRTIARLGALPTDWDWSKSWEENQQAGALPDQGLLTTGRVTMTLLLPFSLWLIYQIGKKVNRDLTGLLAVLLLGTNALVMLHGRRAMAEGVLVLGTILALWGILQAGQRPWLAGLCAAMVFNAKHTGLVLLPVSMLAACWPLPGVSFRWGKASGALIQVLGVFILLTLVLNPFLWSNPRRAIQSAWSERQELVQRQLANTARLTPGQVLSDPARRAAALLANLYILEPSFAEVGNYQAQTAAAERAYLSMPGTNLFRGYVWGSLLFTFTLAGIAIAITRLRRLQAIERRNVILVLIAMSAQVLSLIWLVPLPWQRYVIALVPYVCVWIAYCLDSFIQVKKR
jgi:hypothetical protein